MSVSVGSPHTAITTWSGFIYQGKVALYHVLDLLQDVENYKEFTLQLDSLDDFAILNGTEAIISLHQVKAKKTQYYSGYKDAFEKLKQNSIYYGCNNANFHLAKEILDETIQEIETSHSPVKVYKYGMAGWCAVHEIDGKIEEQIKIIFNILPVGDVSKQDDGYLRKTRIYLEQIILKKVLDIHAIVHSNLMSDRDAAYTQKISFTEFIVVLQKDLNQEDLGEDYYFFLLLNYFHEYYQDYCIENEELNDAELIKLSLCMKEIEVLDKADMVRFICNIMPHREFKFETLRDFKDGSFDKDGIQQAFLTILKELRQPELKPESFFHWYVEEKSFSPTTIDKGESQVGNVCKKIIENAQNTDLDIMFEGCNLITTDINVSSITEAAPEIIRSMEHNDREDVRVSRWKKVSLISLSKAKGIIND